MNLYYTDSSFTQKFLHTQLHSIRPLCLSSTEKLSYLLSDTGVLHTFSKQLKLTQFPFQAKVKSISCGREHCCLLTSMLEIYTWGSGESGALCLGGTDSYLTPQLVNISSDYQVHQVVAGGWHSLIIARQNGGRSFLLASGRNSEGQLGTGRPNRELIPTRVDLKEEVLKAACGNNHSAVLCESGSIYVAGDNRFGQLGLGHKRGSLIFNRVGIEGAEDIACGNHTAAVVGGKVYVWGTAGFGESLIPMPLEGPKGIMSVIVGDAVGCGIGKETWGWGVSKNGEKVWKIEPCVECISVSSGVVIYAATALEVNERGNKSMSLHINSEIATPRNITRSPKMGLKMLKRSYRRSENEATKEDEGKELTRADSRRKENAVGSKGMEELRKLEDRSKELQLEKNEINVKNQQLIEKLAELEGIADEKSRIAVEKSAESERFKGISEELHKENRAVIEENAKLKEIILKLQVERERLMKSFKSDNEIKLFYEECLQELEDEKQRLKQQNFKEISRHRYENDSLQEILASLREENNILTEKHSKTESELLEYQAKLKYSDDIINSLQIKIQTLQEQLDDLTTANNHLYHTLEKSEGRVQFEYSEGLELPKTVSEDSGDEVYINRKGLSSAHQERLLKAAALKMNIEEITEEMRQVSPPNPASKLRSSQKSFEDVRARVQNLKKTRSEIMLDMKGFEKRFKK